MDKKRLEIIVTGILILVLVFSWLNSFKVLKKKAGQKAASRTAPAQPAAAAPRTALMPAAAREVPGASDKDADWGRDPFSGRIYKAAKEEAQKDLRLVGIIWDKQKPAAIINNKIVEAGSSVGGNTVVEIKEDRVVLSDGMRTFELKLGQ